MTEAAVKNQEIMNHLGKERIPFFFLIDFELKKPLIQRLDEIDPEELLYDFNGIKNYSSHSNTEKPLLFNIREFPKEKYLQAFQKVQENIRYGNSFLLNLTFPSRIETNYSLNEIFFYSKAKYKIWFRETFVSFSPEIFVKIENGIIRSFPMKGTIDASLPQAKEKLLSNIKETAEHATIVDLIRNDLSRVASQVEVKRFRYIDNLKTHKNEILQMSSEISGVLSQTYFSELGNIIFGILPAGSVSGAPKDKTLEITHSAECADRGYYTGIAGIFDGTNLDSAVLIRFIEKNPDGMFYRSGGGITAKSNPDDEYLELIQKIYVPVA
ncbi:MAG: aminodeoxychorismate synthase component I [Bacteroidales bacterium]|nr:aminodeoxychorismate synthase component I [Bacteroidales bacterium]